MCSNTEGVSSTLKRDGSDYSAAIFGNVLSASSVTIWTDVDGVLSADPRRVPNSIVMPEVSFNEAMELAYYGAKVLHPKTMQVSNACMLSRSHRAGRAEQLRLAPFAFASLPSPRSAPFAT